MGVGEIQLDVVFNCLQCDISGKLLYNKVSWWELELYKTLITFSDILVTV